MVPRSAPGNTTITNRDIFMVYRGVRKITIPNATIRALVDLKFDDFFLQRQKDLVKGFNQTILQYAVLKMISVTTDNGLQPVANTAIAHGVIDETGGLAATGYSEFLDLVPSAITKQTGAINYNGQMAKCMFKPVKTDENTFIKSADWLNKVFGGYIVAIPEAKTSDIVVQVEYYVKCYHKRN